MNCEHCQGPDATVEHNGRLFCSGRCVVAWCQDWLRRHLVSTPIHPPPGERFRDHFPDYHYYREL